MPRAIVPQSTTSRRGPSRDFYGPPCHGQVKTPLAEGWQARLFELRATSPDGRSFEDQGVVLAPGEGWDGAAVGDPGAIVYVSPLGVPSVRLYYTGTSADDPSERGVGVAASFGGRTGFARFVGNPVVALDGEEWAPTIAPGDGDDPSLLYFARASGAVRAGVGGAVYPGSVTFAGE